ncbi:MAG: hypothetical protein AB1611_04575 [bacterium]
MSEQEGLLNYILSKLKSLHIMRANGQISPHKFIFLLMLANLYEENPCRENCFPMESWLDDKFLDTWLRVFPETDPKTVLIEHPYYHLSNDQIWHLKVKTDAEALFHYYKETPNLRLTRRRLVETVEFGYASQEFDTCLRDLVSRQRIIEYLHEQLRHITNPHVQRSEKIVPEETSLLRYGANVMDLSSVRENWGHMQPKPEEGLQTNLFVAYLNSLHCRNAGSENALAESQARNAFFGLIHVSHPLTAYINGILLGKERRHVILTGHAGDGKSTIATELYKRFKELPCEQPLPNDLTRRENLMFNGIAITLIKDFSEWSPVERLTLVDEMLKGDARRFLLISNTGTLLETFSNYERKSPDGNRVYTESEILHRISMDKPCEMQFHNVFFSIINLSMMDNLELAERVFQRMIKADRWAACKICVYFRNCPISRNIDLIQQNEDVVRERIFLIYRRMYEYGTRFTLRQLSGHLAYMITSGLNCEDIVKMSQKAAPPLSTEFMFFNRFFGDNGRDVDSPALQLRTVSVIREQGFGSHPCPTWERRLWMQSKGPVFRLDAKGCDEEFEQLRRCGARLKFDENLKDTKAREQVRRMIFFLHKSTSTDDSIDTYIKTFLNSLMVLNFARWQKRPNAGLALQETTDLLRRILHVLQEHFTGIRFPEGTPSDHLYVTLSRRSYRVRQSAQVVLARFPADDFKLSLISPNNDGAEGGRLELMLKNHRDTTLRLGLPFLDYVMMRNQGEIGESLQASYIDRLERFKGQLIRLADVDQGEGIMLIRARTNHTFKRQIYALRGSRLEVTDG